jgi:hypothetical protein
MHCCAAQELGPKWNWTADWGDGDDWDEDWAQTGENETVGGLDLASIFAATGAMDIDIDTLENWSDMYYPDLYCGCIQATETACYEQNIVELWGDQVQYLIIDSLSYQHLQGHYNEVSDRSMEFLTQAEILDTVNNKNISGIFLRDFNFTELLGDIRKDENGYIIG